MCNHNNIVIIIVPQIKANNYIMSSVNSGEGSLEIIQEDQEPDNDQQPIEVLYMYLL